MAEANRTRYLRLALLVFATITLTGTLSAQETVKHLNPVIEKLAAGKPFIGFQAGDLSLQNARTLARADMACIIGRAIEPRSMRTPLRSSGRASCGGGATRRDAV